MQQIVYFLKKFRFFLLFLLLELIALFFTIQHHSFHKSKFVNSANSITGGAYEKLNSFTEFLNLKGENQKLIEENTRLKNFIEKFAVDTISNVEVIDDSIGFQQKYEFFYAKIINNNFTKVNNYLTLNRGSNSGVKPDMGVVNSLGIIGVTKNVSKNNSTVLSILNNYSKINVRLKDANHFGTLIWNGKDYNTCQIIDIPRQAILKTGDTVITGGKSAIFPGGILVGVIEDFKIENNQFKEINVRLFNDMSALGYVQIIKNLQRDEQLELEEETINE